MPRFVPRQRKHKVLARQNQSLASTTPSTADSNAAQIIPASKVEKEEKRQKLRAELRAQQSSVSSKKQKRLDKYIENKLKKDENLEYLRMLEQEKEKNDLTALQSSKNLGKRSFGDFVNGTGPEQELKITDKAKKQASDLRDDGGSVSDASEDSFEIEHPDAFTEQINGVGDVVSSELKLSVAQQGSGLAQPLVLGEDGLPVIQQKQRKKKRKNNDITFVIQKPAPIDLPWEGFGSETDDDDDNVETDSESEISVGDGYETDEEIDSDLLDDSEESQNDSGEDSDTSESSVSSTTKKPKPRNSAFKAWATQQINQSLGHVPSYESHISEMKIHQPSASKPESNGKVVSDPEPRLDPTVPNRKAYAVHVDRREEIQATRSELPIIQREQEIMEAIHNHHVVVIKSETGSGKTTQIPQFLYEAGYGTREGPTEGMIGITQPRRVAAVSMAKRVADELGDHGDKVSYQIRFDSSVTPKTAIKFMTDGILLREMSQDLLLRKYSVIVIDEAHERSVNTDILIGLLCKIVPARLRKSQFNPNPMPLKLVIMSATINIDDFLSERLFAAEYRPQMVGAEGRQHRVTTHFALRSRADYLEEVVEKVSRAHRKLPKGGILIFLTGQNEIRQVGEQLRKLLVRGNPIERAETNKMHIAAKDIPLEIEDMEFGADERDDYDVNIVTQSDEEDEDKEFEISDDEGENETTPGQLTNPKSAKDPYTSVHVLPLYSQLPTKEQLRVFEEPPEGSRLIVLATNVAETSLTIPGIRYVFDTGRSKERKYNLETGVQSFEVDYISKASASQRAGRAGRTGPGHCWRLYTSAVYERYFPDYTEPEILRAPAESVVLQLKGVEYPRPITDFPFPTPPVQGMLVKAERLLKNLGALKSEGKITELGKQLSLYPLPPRLGKILARGVEENTVLNHVISLVAGLSVSEIFIPESSIDMTPRGRQEDEIYKHEDREEDEQREKRRQEYGRARASLSRQDKTSDAVRLLTAVSSYSTASDKDQFCKDHFLRPKAMSEVIQLQSQLLSIVKANSPLLSEKLKQHASNVSASNLSSKQLRSINAISASGFIDQIAIRADLSPNPPVLPTNPRRAIDVAYLPLIPLSNGASATLLDKAIFIHPSSILAKHSQKDLPQCVVYTHLQKSQARTITQSAANVDGGAGATTKTRMFPLCPIDPASLVVLAKDTALLEFGKPVAKTKIDEVPGTPKKRECWVTTELRADGGSGVGRFGWPLPPLRVRQIMDVKAKTGWRVEEVLS